MQSADTVLNVIRQYGSRGTPLKRVYRVLYNRDLFLLAYGRIYRNNGAMTAGSTPETVDGMALEKIDAIIAALRNERYRWTPVRRIYIEKKHSTKKRPLGIPTWSDKLLQEVLRLILEAYYEPRFSPHAHGFRPNKGCHTALLEINRNWTGTSWFLEGDISQCFDSLDHSVLMSILAEHIQDNRFLRLIQGLLQAGYLEEWTYHKTLSGSPQGGICSPILANIYLDRFDQYIAKELVPAWMRGTRRKENPAYRRARTLLAQARRSQDTEASAEAKKRLRKLPSVILNDPGYRRLRYVRYADDFLLGFCGPRQEVVEIKEQIGQYLRNTLKLTLSDNKTLITHARTSAARFLGYNVATLQEDHRRDAKGRRSTNGSIGFTVPPEVIKAKLPTYLRHGKATHRQELICDTVFSIVEQYQQEYRGLVEYYQMAYNLSTQMRRLKWYMEQSLTKTLASKLRTSVPQVYRRYKASIQTPTGPQKGLLVKVEREGKKPLEAVWGGISLQRRTPVFLDDAPQPVWNKRTELVQRLLAQTCELCGSQENVEVHHVRALKDLTRRGRPDKPKWEQTMIARHRKTLVVCQTCHDVIHGGKADGRQATN